MHRTLLGVAALVGPDILAREEDITAIDIVASAAPRADDVEFLGASPELIQAPVDEARTVEVLCDTGVIELGENDRGRVRGVEYTLDDGILYDAPALLRDVSEIVASEKAGGATQDR